MDGQCRIFILYNSGLLAQGIRSLLEREKGARIVGFERNAPKALESVRTLKPDVLIVESGATRKGLGVLHGAVQDAGIHTVVTLSLQHNQATVYKCEICRIDSMSPAELAKTILDSRSRCRTDPISNGNRPTRNRKAEEIQGDAPSARFAPDSKRRAKERSKKGTEDSQLATRSRGRLT